MAALADLIGPREALASFHRRGSWHELFPQVVAVLASRDQILPEQTLLVFWNPTCPANWLATVERALGDPRIRLLRWPSWYRWVVGIGTNLFWTVRTLLSSAGAIVRQGITRGTREREPVPLMIELIEEGRMGGSADDTNYWEDGVRLRREDILYFLTPEQRRMLTRHGRNVDAMLSRLRAKDYRIVDIGDLTYSRSAVRELATIAGRLLRSFPRLGAPCLARVFWEVFRTYLRYRLLFDTFAPDNVLYTQNPNGQTGARLDSAIMTGLCRRHSTRSVGYQNRCIYHPVYEDCFDCYDVYLAWGRASARVLGTGFRFVDEVVEVGCMHNDGLDHRPFTRRHHADGVVISVFTHELTSNINSAHGNLSLLETCVDLAERYPDCRFQVKTKDADMVPILLGDDAFRRRCEKVSNNFRFLNTERHGCAPIIRESDIVIAAAFTTPGNDALLLGKRVIFYREGWDGGVAFDGFPDLVATSPAELMRTFDQAMTDFHDYSVQHRDLLLELDPFRDGKVRDRILDVLTRRQDSVTQTRASPVRAQAPA